MTTPGPQPAPPAESSPVQKMTLPTLTAMVIGGMVGAGVFSAAGVLGVVGPWTGRITL